MKGNPLKLTETQKIAESLIEKVDRQRQHALVIGLYGDLGAGKTTFMQFFGSALGIKDKILSPTFVIEKIYKVDHKNFDHLVHIDAYRLESPNELINLGWEEILANPRNIICVEWADKVADILPKDMVSIKFEHNDEESRIIEVING